ncbi:MAG: serine hydrolase [Candidatus Marinimicrobia bacterium]|nr:serine hydrolase [Candidatus Neomarinimicrobiota bacterium]
MLITFSACQRSGPAEVHTDAVLQAALEELIDAFPADAGVYVRHLGTGQSASIRADEIFPTASMIKVPIMLALFEKIAAGELDYNGQLEYHDSLFYAGSDILGSFKSGEKITLSKLVMLMESFSNNTASLWCQSLAGAGTAINQWLDAHGYTRTRMNSRTPGRHGDWETYGWGQTSPREMAELVAMIHEGRAVNPAASEEMYRVLCRPYWDAEALSQVPPWVQAASKTGAVDKSRSEVVLVNGPSGDYVFCVITKNQTDTSWGADNVGFVLQRDVSRLLWQYFEPDHPWEPTPGMEDWS